jgi:general secretion pathway protein A
MNRKLLALYGLKFHPFCAEIPVEALQRTPRIESFCWRIEQLIGEGGFGLLTGPSGVGKSATLRVLAERLSGLRDVRVGVLSRPQAGLADFYREMGDLFGVELHPHNRYGGAKMLRERWQAHIDAAASRPVLVIDEAQETQQAVLGELRLLSSSHLDSHMLLTVVLAGDQRLPERFRCEELVPLGSRIRVKLTLDRAPPEELRDCLVHALHSAGAPKLMTMELIATLCDHAQGNLRALMNLAGELLDLAAQREAPQLDEKLFFEAFNPPAPVQTKAAARPAALAAARR